MPTPNTALQSARYLMQVSPGGRLFWIGFMLASLVRAIQAAPANDNFANRIPLSGLTSTSIGSNVGASSEAVERNHLNSSAGLSVWWSWTAPENGLVVIDTLGSSFDTILAVYTGTIVESLSLVRENDDGPVDNTSRVSFTAAAGTVYQIVVDGLGSFSGNIVLNIAQQSPLPAVTVSPASTNLLHGSSVTFIAGATGQAPLAYQWYFGTTLLAGEINPTLALASLTTNQSGSYRVIVTNSLGAATNTGILSVIPPVPPAVSVVPTVTNAPAGGAVTFMATATGDEPLSYQWYRGNTPLTDETNPSLTLSALTLVQAGIYKVVVSNPVGSDTNTTTLNVIPASGITTTANSGPGSLRNAILYANSNPGFDTITFHLPAGAVHTINLSSPLPEITQPVLIDGTSQAGYAGVPRVIIFGGYSHGPLLKLTAGGSTVRGLALQGAGSDNGGSADGIWLAGGTNTVTGCYLGLAVNGVDRVPNLSTGIRILDSSVNSIGGLTAAERNYFADTLLITGIGASNNVVLGNVFGLQADGASRIDGGLLRIVDASGNIIGGAAAGARNVLRSGVVLSGTATGNLIQGNYIGTTVAGGAVAGIALETTDGVTLEASGNLIIGNLIAGNPCRGIFFDGTFNPSGNVIQGNFIGTDPTGTLPVPNDVGIELYGDRNRIGGSLPAERNVISGNRTHGLWLRSGNTNQVRGNFFGTDANGQNRLAGAQATTNGLYFTATGTGNTLGGLAPGERNLFSGNNRTGANFDDHARNAVFVGNWLGLAADGTTLLGNTVRGLQVAETEGGNYFASNVVAGHSVEGLLIGRVQGIGTATNVFLANTVRNNSGKGITLAEPARNVIRQNSIFENAGMGIDLFNNGTVDFNPAGSEFNYPVLTNVRIVGGKLLIEGSLRAPVGSYTVEFYANLPTDNPPQARTYLGETTVAITQPTAQGLAPPGYSQARPRRAGPHTKRHPQRHFRFGCCYRFGSIRFGSNRHRDGPGCARRNRRRRVGHRCRRIAA